MRRTTIALLLALAACGGGTTTPGASPTASVDENGCPLTGGVVAPSPRPASTATIDILSPEDGALIEGDSVTVEVAVGGACLLEEAQTSVRPDTGHVHVLVDGIVKNLLAGLRSEVTGLSPGTHIIEAEFTAADHGAFDPQVIDRVTVRVTG